MSISFVNSHAPGNSRTSAMEEVKSAVLNLEVRVLWEEQRPYIARGVRQGNIKVYPTHKSYKYSEVLSSPEYTTHRAFLEDVLCKMAKKAVKTVKFYEEYQQPLRDLLVDLNEFGEQFDFSHLVNETQNCLQSSTNPRVAREAVYLEYDHKKYGGLLARL